MFKGDIIMEIKIYNIINNHTRGKLTPSERRILRDKILEEIHKSETTRANNNAVILEGE